MKNNMKNKTIPNLPFSLNDLENNLSTKGPGLRYMGLTTTGSYIFFDGRSGCVYRYNINSGYLRRNSPITFDSRDQLVTRNRIQPDELLEVLNHYVPVYRKTMEKRKKNRNHYA